ncbi:MAG: TetR/AcrR family transcriptional regulator [Planctomycetes bacterium]|nr:TetR/AcrR family transcriptional regulator [Planctomycetota bacterium]
MVREHLTAEERKEKILAEATRLFARRGFEGTTSAALARACGVSEALLYKLFSTKRQLYAAMIEHKLASWDPLEVEPDTEETLEEVLQRLAERVFEKVEADPDFVRLLHYSELQESEFAELFHEKRGNSLLSQLQTYLQRRIDASELRADVDPALIGSSFLCLTWHYACGIKVFERGDVFPQTPDAVAIRFLVSIFVRGLRP